MNRIIYKNNSKDILTHTEEEQLIFTNEQILKELNSLPDPAFQKASRICDYYLNCNQNIEMLYRLAEEHKDKLITLNTLLSKCTVEVNMSQDQINAKIEQQKEKEKKKKKDKLTRYLVLVVNSGTPTA